jgi:hypothetical protein
MGLGTLLTLGMKVKQAIVHGKRERTAILLQICVTSSLNAPYPDQSIYNNYTSWAVRQLPCDGSVSGLQNTAIKILSLFFFSSSIVNVCSCLRLQIGIQNS